MRISTVFYTLRQGFGNLFRNKWFTLASIATISACLFLFGLFYAIVTNFQNIVKTAEGAMADGVALDTDSLVSMNMWGLTPDFLEILETGFARFFEKEVPVDPLKAEYLIPTFIGELLAEGKMDVKVLRTNDTWYGMTYKEDVMAVRDSFKEMFEKGIYKADLFSDL